MTGGVDQVRQGVVARTLKFEQRTLPQILQIQRKLGDKPLLRCGDSEMSYCEAPVEAARYAGKLRELGVGPGDRVLCFMHSRVDVLKLWLGITWLGAIMVPVNTALRGEQLRHAVTTADPRLTVTENGLLGYLVQEGAVAGENRVFVIDEAGEHHACCEGRFVVDVEPVDPYPVTPGDTAAILYTSGTTGPSKGVLCPHGQFYWWGVMTGESLRLSPDDVLFTVLPFFHTNALNSFWQALVFGATFTFESSFSASRFWQQAEGRGATVTYLLGAMAQILLTREPGPNDISHRVRIALCPATPIEAVVEFERRFGVRLVEGYGSTETNFVCSNVIGEHVPASMGRVADGFEVRVVDENDCDSLPGEPGELLIRHREPFSMASGYFRNAEATVKAWRNLWFHTGDRVVQRSDGVFYFLDRIVDAIRRRGENISSWEVETALKAHPIVEEAAVVGVPSDLGSEQDVMAFIVLREGVEAAPEEIVRFLESRLAYFAIPRYWDFVGELPMTANNKVRKHVLRDRGVTASTWDIEQSGIRLSRGGKSA
ncbi:AMP-binding protein [Kineobactrum salinum]|uniref:AMP-binding protein n=1 Tax=Kineobactrum salinum TaxID=2708301 RepID=A0A6C0TWF0_9GAMM|nr:AMP-binding protein [Kineobactrum salinum]QIB64140.1 AMP-binding protein [Kineobactrum salinum]